MDSVMVEQMLVEQMVMDIVNLFTIVELIKDIIN
jgi:hypothetical protein